MSTQEQVKGEVGSYWEDEPCGAGNASAQEGTPELFAQVAAERHALEPFIPKYAGFASTRGRKVLENLTVEHVRTPFERRFAGPLAAATGSLLGWFLVVRGRAPNP
jgi:hypothetical protein